MPPLVRHSCNRRVTCDFSPSNARSESFLAINPLNPNHMVGASKRFTDPATYQFSLATYVTFDGGLSWGASAPLQLLPDWTGTSDPTLAWDNLGNVFLFAMPFRPPMPGETCIFPDSCLLGIAVYKSTDGGRTWSPPNFIHPVKNDDKQWAAGDGNPASPFYGRVYAVWDSENGLAFTRTLDHGFSWIGWGANPVGYPLALAAGFADLSIAADGSLYVVGVAGSEIRFTKSTDGGETFSPASVIASGITPNPPPFHVGGGLFRVFTLPTGCAGNGDVVLVAWADSRDPATRIYYARSANGGNSWPGPAAGKPLLSGALEPANDQHDFHPQLIAAPSGEIGCAFYEYGPKTVSAPSLIDVKLAVSSNDGSSFGDLVTVTDHPWDPAIDAPYAHGDPNLTFIGDYFGLDASRLGFFPFWTDTRTLVQEIFAARIPISPADVRIRDSSMDDGIAPSGGGHWEAPDLVVRQTDDGFTNFWTAPLKHDGVTNHYVYARVWNDGPNTARNVTVAVTVANWPGMNALPGTEFRYPQDWYEEDWTAAQWNPGHHYLGETPPLPTLASGANQIVGPILWPASEIPDPTSWHPCLLAEVRADNSDSAGGPDGCEVDADPDPCIQGAYFWGTNNACQSNLSYQPFLKPLSVVNFSFLVGSLWSEDRFLDIIIDKGRHLAEVEMQLRVEKVIPRDSREQPVPRATEEIILLEPSRALVRVGGQEVGELEASPRAIWRPVLPKVEEDAEERLFGAQKRGEEYRLTSKRASVGFRVRPGERRQIGISFRLPPHFKPGEAEPVLIYQRNARRAMTGVVQLVLGPPPSKPTERTATPKRTLKPKRAQPMKQQEGSRRRPTPVQR